MTLRDLHNLKAKVKQNAISGRKDAENTLCLLTDILQNNTEDRAGMAVDEENVLSVVYYQVRSLLLCLHL